MHTFNLFYKWKEAVGEATAYMKLPHKLEQTLTWKFVIMDNKNFNFLKKLVFMKR